MNITISMLSTVDNPFDPFTDFTNWYMYDNDCGYNSCGILARIYNNTEEKPASVEARLMEEAIDAFIAGDPTGNYIKVQKVINLDDYDQYDPSEDEE